MYVTFIKETVFRHVTLKEGTMSNRLPEDLRRNLFEVRYKHHVNQTSFNEYDEEEGDYEDEEDEEYEEGHTTELIKSIKSRREKFR